VEGGRKREGEGKQRLSDQKKKLARLSIREEEERRLWKPSCREKGGESNTQRSFLSINEEEEKWQAQQI